MCEVAILSASEYSANDIAEAAMALFRSMRTSLGVVSVENTGAKYDFEVFKALDPSLTGVENFIAKRHDDAVRFILHGRLATHGGNDIAAAHPIQIDCDECDVEYVIHNGVVMNHKRIRAATEPDGHSYRTKVDSEVIAHKYGQTPTEISEIDETFEREPCYILLQEDRVLIHAGPRYSLSKDGRMARARREFAPSEGKYQDLIMEPERQEVPA